MCCLLQNQTCYMLRAGVADAIQDILSSLSTARKNLDDDSEVFSSSLLLLGPPGVGMNATPQLLACLHF